MAYLYLPALSGFDKKLMLSTGFDRDLSMAGRVMVKDNDGRFVQKLAKIEKPSMTSLTTISIAE